MQVFAGFGKLSKEEKPVVGAEANRVKVALESALEEKSKEVKNAALAKSLEEEKLDVTLPGRSVNIGRLHPSTQQLRRVLAILAEMGFQVYTSREVETDEMNFQMLNFPPDHPARDMQDRFYRSEWPWRQPNFDADAHLAGQIHAMREAPRPTRRTRLQSDRFPGMCFRYKQITARSEAVQPGGRTGHWQEHHPRGLRRCSFVRRMFGGRAAALPLVLPVLNPLKWTWNVSSAAARDARSARIRAGRNSWLRHVHLLFAERRLRPEIYSGFAWGMGHERQLMLRNKINDIRYWGNDVRFWSNSKEQTKDTKDFHNPQSLLRKVEI